MQTSDQQEQPKSSVVRMLVKHSAITACLATFVFVAAILVKSKESGRECLLWLSFGLLWTAWIGAYQAVAKARRERATMSADEQKFMAPSSTQDECPVKAFDGLDRKQWRAVRDRIFGAWTGVSFGTIFFLMGTFLVKPDNWFLNLFFCMAYANMLSGLINLYRALAVMRRREEGCAPASPGSLH
ncbi:MAG: hypothetical protein JW818_04225 [Pirellulales bacterium]|nr:hypothetical protein [Pirellulales bacterium]